MYWLSQENKKLTPLLFKTIFFFLQKEFFQMTSTTMPTTTTTMTTTTPTTTTTAATSTAAMIECKVEKSLSVAFNFWPCRSRPSSVKGEFWRRGEA